MKTSILLSCFTLTTLFAFIIFAPLASASESTPATNYTAAKKFQRGLHNGVTGWMEVPVTVQKMGWTHDWFESWTTGVARGVGLAFARTGAGIYEVATFPFAAPEKFEPVMMPERVEG